MKSWMNSAVLGGALLIGAAAPALAEQDTHDGAYVSVAVGAANLMDADLEYPDNADRNRTASFENGPVLSGAIGYAFAGPFRAEGELAYRRNPNGFLLPGGGGEGDASSVSLMANALYDLPLGSSVVHPYVGLGLGVATVSHSGLEADGSVLADDSGWALAYQAIVGARAPLSPDRMIGAEYRFLGAADPKIDDATGFTYDTNYDSHALLITFTQVFR